MLTEFGINVLLENIGQWIDEICVVRNQRSRSLWSVKLPHSPHFIIYMQNMTKFHHLIEYWRWIPDIFHPKGQRLTSLWPFCSNTRLAIIQHHTLATEGEVGLLRLSVLLGWKCAFMFSNLKLLYINTRVWSIVVHHKLIGSVDTELQGICFSPCELALWQLLHILHESEQTGMEITT